MVDIIEDSIRSAVNATRVSMEAVTDAKLAQLNVTIEARMEAIMDAKLAQLNATMKAEFPRFKCNHPRPT